MSVYINLQFITGLFKFLEFCLAFLQGLRPLIPPDITYALALPFTTAHVNGLFLKAFFLELSPKFAYLSPGHCCIPFFMPLGLDTRLSTDRWLFQLVNDGSVVLAFSLAMVMDF